MTFKDFLFQKYGTANMVNEESEVEKYISTALKFLAKKLGIVIKDEKKQINFKDYYGDTVGSLTFNINDVKKASYNYKTFVTHSRLRKISSYLRDFEEDYNKKHKTNFYGLTGLAFDDYETLVVRIQVNNNLDEATNYTKLGKQFLDELVKVNKKDGMKIIKSHITSKGNEVSITAICSFNDGSKWLDGEWVRKFMFYRYNNFEEQIKKCFDAMNLENEPRILSRMVSNIAGSPQQKQFNFIIEF